MTRDDFTRALTSTAALLDCVQSDAIAWADVEEILRNALDIVTLHNDTADPEVDESSAEIGLRDSIARLRSDARLGF